MKKNYNVPVVFTISADSYAKARDAVSNWLKDLSDVALSSNESGWLPDGMTGFRVNKENMKQPEKPKQFAVFHNGKPAVLGRNHTWSTHIFSSLEEAQAYARDWLGHYSPGRPLQLNEEYSYSGYGDVVVIKEVKE